MKFINNDSGYSLIELSLSAGLFSLTMLALSYLSVRNLSISNQSSLTLQMDTFLTTLRTILKDDDGCKINFAVPFATPAYDLKDSMTGKIAGSLVIQTSGG